MRFPILYVQTVKTRNTKNDTHIHDLARRSDYFVKILRKGGPWGLLLCVVGIARTPGSERTSRASWVAWLAAARALSV